MNKVYIAGECEYNNSISHHGIKGQKWGIRRYENSDGTLTEEGKKRYNYSDGIKSIKDKYRIRKADAKKRLEKAGEEWERNNKNRSLKDQANNYTKSDKKFDAESDRYINDMKKIKKDRKNEINKYKKDSVSKYSKAMDDLIKKQEILDKKWDKVKDLYKETGKNGISRFINNMKGKSDKSKKYSKEYDKIISEQEKLDKREKEVKELYKKTGSNKISRIYNNVKYRKSGK